MLGRFPIEVFRVGIVGEMVAKFWEKVERCLHFNDSSSRIYDLILGPIDG
jgi:hypothetical protein